MTPYKTVNGLLTLLAAAVVMPCLPNTIVRSVIRDHNIQVWVNGAILFDLQDSSALTGGQPGIGVAETSGSSMSHVYLGALDMEPPLPMDVNSIGVSAFPNSVDLQWPEAADNAKADARNLEWAASFAANMLASNRDILAKKYPHLDAAHLLQATPASYNLGTGQISGNPDTIDVGSAPGGKRGNYGSNVVNLMDCYK